VTNDALAKLYTQYGALVHRRCRTLLGHDADANDALQETFMRVQRYPPTDVAALLPWLHGVAARVCFDQLARQKRSRPTASGVLGRLKEVMGGVTHDSAEAKLCLGSELAKLEETTREMALLHWLDGMTQDEVAERTGYSRKTVGVKLKAAETTLRSAFGDGVVGGTP
jgi:RNA polymerase sigma-70 factor, ECF subfamily